MASDDLEAMSVVCSSPTLPKTDSVPSFKAEGGSEESGAMVCSSDGDVCTPTRLNCSQNAQMFDDRADCPGLEITDVSDAHCVEAPKHSSGDHLPVADTDSAVAQKPKLLNDSKSQENGECESAQSGESQESKDAILQKDKFPVLSEPKKEEKETAASETQVAKSSELKAEAPSFEVLGNKLVVKSRKSRKRGGSRFGEAPVCKKRRKRWGQPVADTLITAMASAMDPKAAALRAQIGELQRAMSGPMIALLCASAGSRSPSPAPEYDRNGNRTNTREVRKRKQLLKQRNDAIHRLLQMDGSYKPPSDYRAPKVVAIVYLPTEEYPDCDFAGKIIGAKGSNHQKMQKETGCRITVKGLHAREALAKVGANMEEYLDACNEARGKRALAEVRSAEKAHSGDYIDGVLVETHSDDGGDAANGQKCDLQPQHVEVIAQMRDNLAKGIAAIQSLVKETIEGLNSGSRQLLLASKYGVDSAHILVCRICGGVGHPIYRCPERGQQWEAADVQCAICAEVSHVTEDCKHFDKRRPLADVISEYRTAVGGPLPAGDEYDAFLASLTDVTATSRNMLAIGAPKTERQSKMKTETILASTGGSEAVAARMKMETETAALSGAVTGHMPMAAPMHTTMASAPVVSGPTHAPPQTGCGPLGVVTAAMRPPPHCQMMRAPHYGLQPNLPRMVQMPQMWVNPYGSAPMAYAPYGYCVPQYNPYAATAAPTLPPPPPPPGRGPRH